MKGKNISIAHDQTQQQIQDGKILRTHLKLSREKGIKDSYIKGEKLYVNGTVYTVEDLSNIQTPEPNKQGNSAPHTPIPEKHSNVIEELEQPVVKNTQQDLIDTPTTIKSQTHRQANQKQQPVPSRPNTRNQRNNSSSRK